MYATIQDLQNNISEPAQYIFSHIKFLEYCFQALPVLLIPSIISAVTLMQLTSMPVSISIEPSSLYIFILLCHSSTPPYNIYGIKCSHLNSMYATIQNLWNTDSVPYQYYFYRPEYLQCRLCKCPVCIIFSLQIPLHYKYLFSHVILYNYRVCLVYPRFILSSTV